MIIVRKMKFWSLLFVLGLAVFAFSGCGGSASSDSDEEDSSTPNSLPDTYDTAALLTGAWVFVGENESSITLTSGDETTLSMTLSAASLIISDVNIDNVGGTASITLHETWRAFLNGDSTEYYGLVPINMDNQIMSLTKTAKDNWRCDVYEPYRSSINIEILKEDIISLTENRVVAVEGMPARQYENTMSFRKQN